VQNFNLKPPSSRCDAPVSDKASSPAPSRPALWVLAGMGSVGGGGGGGGFGGVAVRGIVLASRGSVAMMLGGGRVKRGVAELIDAGTWGRWVCFAWSIPGIETLLLPDGRSGVA